jgi:hypothetical protein
LKTCTGTFQFGSDFYQANAKVTLTATGRELSMRWPSGETSALIPLGRDHFFDRSYWEEVTIEREASGTQQRSLTATFEEWCPRSDELTFPELSATFRKT